MNIEELRQYCLSQEYVTETTPFGPEVLVFKVHNKMFALCGLDQQPPQINLKCDPERATLLREEYEAVKPGYHMNKTHWNTVVSDGSLSPNLIKELIDHSYQLVFDSLPLKLRQPSNK